MAGVEEYSPPAAPQRRHPHLARERPLAKKIFVLDTSVLLHTADSLFNFAEHDVVIPVVVLNELDTFKRGTMEINRNARLVIKQLDHLREDGRLDRGIPLPSGGTVTVELNHRDAMELLPPGFDTNNDNRILAVALALKKRHPRRHVAVVSKDINMRVKAQTLGLHAEDYLNDKIELDELYPGNRVLKVSGRYIDTIYQERELPVSALNGAVSKDRLSANEFVMLVNSANENATALARFDADRQALTLLREQRGDVWGVRPLNREQRYALEILLDDRVRLVTLSGKAGTGKTMLAIAAGLHKVVNEKTYRRLAVYRPVIPMGKDIGYLPGSEQDKLQPWMQPIFDNLEYLLDAHSPSSKKGSPGQGGRTSSPLDYLIDANVLEIGALTYIRGRSLPGLYIIIDESQNLTPHEVKTIVTRAGEGTKLVFTGDPNQIDHPYLDATSNGLTHLVEKFKGHSIAGHVTLVKGERSELAELASTVLEA
ncbi:MAG: PhoH family protein [Proteobacteria bacterium]|nr:PhoH family protein [Pseudomonadota bacterium]